MENGRNPYDRNRQSGSNNNFDVDEIIKKRISQKISAQKLTENRDLSDNSSTKSHDAIRRSQLQNGGQSRQQPSRATTRLSQQEQRRRENASIMSYGVLKGVVYAVGIIIISIILSYIILASAGDLLGLFKDEFIVEIQIPQNTTIKQIAKILKENEIITQPSTFKFYTSFKEDDLEILEGTYRFNGNMSYDEILNVLKNSVRSDETVRITIPEGFTAWEIAERLEENRVCQASDFIKTLQEGEFNYEFISQIPESDDRYLKLEGYLFPDTYDFYVGENTTSVIKKFLRNFQNKMNSDIEKRMEDIGMTMDEVVILASVIQGEAGVRDEMHMVSSVFRNRMKNSGTFPMLESDATRDYVNDFVTPHVSAEQNAKFAAAYNTYRCEGLPAGAVTNPGLAAIKAALYPETSSYYYFVTDEDGTFYYASTMSQHEINVANARKKGLAQGTSTEEE